MSAQAPQETFGDIAERVREARAVAEVLAEMVATLPVPLERSRELSRAADLGQVAEGAA